MAERGGRGGGRGGRGGGARGGGRRGPPTPWDYESPMTEQPQETYPKTYKPPVISEHPLSSAEIRAKRYFLTVYRIHHNSPLYTHQHLAPGHAATSSKISDPVVKSYGQEQVNAKYGVKNRATIDPFTAVPMYSHRFVDDVRTLPDFRAAKGWEIQEQFFPEELKVTISGKDGPSSGSKESGKRGAKRKSLALVENDSSDDDVVISRRRRGAETEEERKRRIAEAAEGGDHEEGDVDVDLDEEEEEGVEEDDNYEDDEDGGDYDAEQYFDDGADEAEDDGMGEGGEVDL